MIFANIFQPLIDIFGPILVFFHGIIGGSWGWSIIALTVLIRALMLPLAFKQMHSMQKLQRVAPQLKAIQAKYKEDKQRQQQEMMKFYKENDINPFASCLPLVAQIPVFIGLFYTLRTRLREDICPGLQAAYRHAYALHNPHVSASSIAGQTVACHGLNGSSWLFIHDLTNTATGATLVVLIVLYVGTQLVSSLMMQAPTMDKTQQRMMMLLPLVFVIFIVRFPAGLILYWITTNTWTMAQQYLIRRRIGPEAPAPPVATTTGRDGKGGGAAPNGAGAAAGAGTATGAGAAAGGLAGLLRGRKPQEKQPAAVGSSNRPRREAPPPPSPRKKKKRSGRRR